LLEFLTKDVTISFRKLLAITLLFFSSFTWLFVLCTYFDIIMPITTHSVDILTTSGHVWFLLNFGHLVFLASIAVTAFIGSAVVQKLNLRKFLFFWLIIGIIAPLPALFFQSEEILLVFSCLVGATLGFGFPSILSFLADSTTPEERGRVAAFVIFTSFFLYLLTVRIIDYWAYDFFHFVPPGSWLHQYIPIAIILMLMGLKSIGFFSFIIDPLSKAKSKPKTWSSILGFKNFKNYLLAYIFFSIAFGLTPMLWQPMFNNLTIENASIFRLEYDFRLFLLGFVMLFAGVTADKFGRKKLVILGFLMLIPEAVFARFMLSSIAQGIMMALYLAIPGDLSSPGSREKSYAICWILPLSIWLAIGSIERTAWRYWTDVAVWSPIIATSPDGRFLRDYWNFGSLGYVFLPPELFTIIYFILIAVSILLIVLAVETISESKMQERKFRDYAEKVENMIQETEKED
jgi:MFS family permease